jgi:phosphoribosylaminoimidazole-succinocarboxamide synthase
MQLIRKGKVKEVYDAGPNELLFHFTDQISVFDKVIPTLIPHKGDTLCRTAAYWFRACEKAGIKTHFLAVEGKGKMRVKKVQVIDPAKEHIGPGQRNFMIPLECIARYYAAGSLMDRIKTGEVALNRLGLAKAPAYGEKLPRPFVEFTTKLEKTDRPLSDVEAQELAVMTDEEWYQLEETILRIDALINPAVEKRGLLHVDGKKEFAFDEQRRIMVIDTFGTLDEDRWWDLEAYQKRKETIELSKELVRQHYRKTGYHEQLYAARKAGQPEPPIPALPADVTQQVSDLYIGMYERITGETF